jgi:hypothetical protein
MAPKVEMSRTLKKTKQYNNTKLIPEHPKKSLYVTLLLLEIKDDFYR